MKPRTSLRTAAFFVLFFALGHSIGHFTRKDTNDPKASEVLRAMETYKFPIGMQFRSYDEFYTGMSLNMTLTLITLSILLWLLSSQTENASKNTTQLLYPILLCLLAFAITSFLYFFLVPAITSLAAILLILYAIIRLKKEVHIPNQSTVKTALIR
ncbi:hypothetical protein IC229_33105 [Spirosoma sp. BT702]|uniref:Uncharacterized protein n=1 Tax=Spirosoma profusum TaxID=2771354 RepID=A0A927AW41_9BACT|nr:hypothetical protein [Spirosoma profusum]MBD2705497.1 hypothetical protein [Spirosoma profusum]